MSERMNHNLIDAILELKAKEPFAPFRIVLSSGHKYPIENGGNLVEMRTEFFYASPRKDGFVFLRKSQIAAVEGINGRQAAKRRT